MNEWLKLIFVNHRRQLRSGWKIGMILIIYLIGAAIWKYCFPNTFETDLGFFTIDSMILLGAIFSILKWVDRKQLSDIGFTNLNGNFWDLGFGLILGAVSMSIIFLVLAFTGQILVESSRFLSRNFSISLLNSLLLFILVGFREEIFSRGYCLFALRQMRRLWLAVLLSSLIFALLHLTTPYFNLISFVNILIVGILFSFMVLQTGNLWMSIGYHITWNYFQGSIFGFPVSGQNFMGVYSIQIRNRNLLTGGLYGPEGGVLTTAVLLMGFVVVWLYTMGRARERRLD